jgi:hypothetical protein
MADFGTFLDVLEGDLRLNGLTLMPLENHGKVTLQARNKQPVFQLAPKAGSNPGTAPQFSR